MKKIEAYLSAQQSKIGLVIWDWNGTLLDDLDLCVESIGHQLKRHGLPAVSAEVHRELFGFPVQHFYERLGFNLEQYPFESLSRDYMETYEPTVYTRGKLFQGAREMLESVRTAGIRQAVLSAAREDHLQRQIAHFGIASYFEQICGLGDAHAKSKVERGRQLLESTDIDPSRVLLIGDTNHDLEVGEALGVTVLLLADGHQHPTRFARRPDQVLESRY